MPLSIATAIWGRRFGLSSTYALVDQAGNKALTIDSTGLQANSTVLTFDRLHLVANATAVTSATLVNYGQAILSTATATAQTFTMYAPVLGILKVLSVGRNTASEITIQGTATTILFGSTGADKIFFAGADVRGRSVTLMGESTTRWSVIAAWGGQSATAMALTGGA